MTLTLDIDEHARLADLLDREIERQHKPCRHLVAIRDKLHRPVRQPHDDAIDEMIHHSDRWAERATKARTGGDERMAAVYDAMTRNCQRESATATSKPAHPSHGG